MKYLLYFLMLLPIYSQAGSNLLLVSDPWCPVVCNDDPKKPGYFVELAKAIFEPAGYSVKYDVVPFARAEAMMNSGEAAGFLGVLKLPKRQSWVFPVHPQAISRVCFYTQPSSNWRFHNEESLRGIRLGTIRGYSYGSEIDALLPLSQVDPVNGVGGFQRSVAKLNAGRVSTLVEYELVAQYQMYQMGYALREAGCAQRSDALYLAFSPRRVDAAQLAKLLDEGIKKMRKTGELQKILKPYGLVDWVDKGRVLP
ncbi:transporter substrate-binding domain-containing protein [Chitinibacter sp. SCUT-21]|uniref:substrate-binding periplasmic protein n=1 Tax=Chitinibacter sp. SCUT-21 TaxID=2970891 RepID=UPI0035A5715B